METIACINCGERGKRLFDKRSGRGEIFSLMGCPLCGLEFISPRPYEKDMGEYYSLEYFTRRTDRGYDNYFSPGVRSEIERVFELNLEDLGFYQYEKSIGSAGLCLDIGCAAGYFVNFMRDRGWDARGIDIAGDCVNFAKGLGLSVTEGSYLETEINEKFDLITMWATIEHLHQPDKFLDRIRDDLKINGMLYISTCRAGFGFKKIFGRGWRFYNFPEHLFYFTKGSMKKLLESRGFVIESTGTYGSGFGRPGSGVRRAADAAAKHFGLGDMMIISARRAI